MAARKRNELGLTKAEEKLVRDTAASKGFNSVDDYALHLLRQTPNWCGILYDMYATDYPCERQDNGERAEHVLGLDKKFYGTNCELYRNLLVSDCNAAFDGKSLQFPDESHLTQKTDLGYKDQQEITAAMFGMTIKEYKDLRRREFDEVCKGLSTKLGECVRWFGPRYKDCNRLRGMIEEYCAKRR